MSLHIPLRSSSLSRSSSTTRRFSVNTSSSVPVGSPVTYSSFASSRPTSISVEPSVPSPLAADFPHGRPLTASPSPVIIPFTNVVKPHPVTDQSAAYTPRKTPSSRLPRPVKRALLPEKPVPTTPARSKRRHSLPFWRKTASKSVSVNVDEVSSPLPSRGSQPSSLIDKKRLLPFNKSKQSSQHMLLRRTDSNRNLRQGPFVGPSSPPSECKLSSFGKDEPRSNDVRDMAVPKCPCETRLKEISQCLLSIESSLQSLIVLQQKKETERVREREKEKEKEEVNAHNINEYQECSEMGASSTSIAVVKDEREWSERLEEAKKRELVRAMPITQVAPSVFCNPNSSVPEFWIEF